MFLRIFQKTWAGIYFLIKLTAECLQIYLKETLTHVFSYEFCEIFKKVFSQNTSGRIFPVEQ